ncbi:hypothetical protein [Gordonia hydrophobica]|uniref:Uncharacterized protein n=1 Tax=Gordonia hydrophobica TaxID=40516 RepID=A0ABZ2U258_9ACTN|nr:hypothetical protein [Gordonia hydrophobica]MBM7368470.1 hypothetical protein [Gordonia hydrophobica]
MTALGWMTRYDAGRHDEIWHELRMLGDRVHESRYRPEAQAVCDEMATRAHQNVTTLVAALTADGYTFTTNDDDRAPVSPHVSPGPRAAELAHWLDERFGIPLAVASWVRIVGDVWFIGEHPRWSTAADADPLVMELSGARYPEQDVRAYLEDDYAQWQEWAKSEPAEAGVFGLPAAPDRLTKANVSGGLPYGFPIPDRSAEGTFRGDVAMPFVAYLNHVFDNAGFPHPTTPPDEQSRLRRELAPRMLRL